MVHDPANVLAAQSPSDTKLRGLLGECPYSMLERLSVPRKGLIGPWAHGYPHFARPGPQIGFLQETLRWWDYWLKGIDTGVMDEPMLRAWMTESVKPASRHERIFMAATGNHTSAPVLDRRGAAKRGGTLHRSFTVLVADRR
jgi:predicted acyl esterase